MKKTIIAALAILCLFGCTDKKAQEKAVLDSIINVHGKVMDMEDQLMKNKSQLDTLLKQDKLSGKDTAKLLISKLVVADSLMDNWMHKFNPDVTGKSDDEAITYMANQKKQIMAIDSQLTAAVAESNKYLHKTKGK